MPPTVSTRNGIEVTWSRCECVMKMWSICESSASVRSPTPVPASIRMSLSTRNEVVRRCRPPIPPEHPSTRRRTRARLLLAERRHAVPAGGGRRGRWWRWGGGWIGVWGGGRRGGGGRGRRPIPPEHPSTRRRTRARLLLAERRHAVPAGGGRRAPELADPPGVEPVEAAVRAQALQVDEIDVGLIPVAGAVAAQGLVPELELCVQGSIELAAERLVDGEGFIPSLHPHSLHFPKNHAPDPFPPSLPYE